MRRSTSFVEPNAISSGQAIAGRDGIRRQGTKKAAILKYYRVTAIGQKQT
jgi:hypothetical protein